MDGCASVVIAPDCWGPLREASQALIAASRKEKVATPVTEAYPSSVLESLSLLASASTTKEKKQLASIMQFTAYVIKFYKYDPAAAAHLQASGFHWSLTESLDEGSSDERGTRARRY